jgi:hypothetical protein
LLTKHRITCIQVYVRYNFGLSVTATLFGPLLINLKFMKTARLILAFLFLVLVTDSCKKDRREVFFPVKPNDFLSASKYEKLVLDIVYVDGYQPSSEAIAHMENFLDQRLNKPGGIFVNYKAIASPGKSSYSQDDLNKIEKKERSHYTKGSTLAAYIFFTDAPYTDQNVLGLTYGTSAFALFEYSVHQNSGGFGQPSRFVLESTVVEHEFGHLLGLVDNGTKMQSNHKDAANGNHCDNQNCLMYYGVETTNILANLTGGNIPSLDDNCIADLRGNGGK